MPEHSWNIKGGRYAPPISERPQKPKPPPAPPPPPKYDPMVCRVCGKGISMGVCPDYNCHGQSQTPVRKSQYEKNKYATMVCSGCGEKWIKNTVHCASAKCIPEQITLAAYRNRQEKKTMSYCCGEKRDMPFCPQCGKPQADADLMELLYYVTGNAEGAKKHLANDKENLKRAKADSPPNLDAVASWEKSLEKRQRTFDRWDARREALASLIADRK